MKEQEVSGHDAYDIKVEKDTVINPRTNEPINGWIGLYRQDDGGCVGMHSESYGHIPYSDIYDCINFEMEKIAAESGSTLAPEFTSYALPYKRTGVMGGRVVMRWTVPTIQKECIQTGDVLNYTYECSPSMDGTAGVPSRTGADRVACMNGMILSDTVMATTFKHSKNVDHKRLIKLVRQSMVEFEKGVGLYSQLFNEELQTRISWAEGHNVIRNLFAKDKDDREAIQKLWEHPENWNAIPDERKPDTSRLWFNPNQFRDQHNVQVNHNGQSEMWKMPALEEHTQTVRIGDLFNCMTDHLTHHQDSRLYAAQRSQKAFTEILGYVGREKSANASLKFISAPPKRTRNPAAEPRVLSPLQILEHNPIEVN